MTTWAQRAWETELHDPAPRGMPGHCHGPIVDRGDQHWPSACHCPRCDWCGVHGAALETVLIEDDEGVPGLPRRGGAVIQTVAALLGLVWATGLLGCFVASIGIWVETVRLIGA